MVGSGNGGSSMDAGGGCEVAGRAGHSRFALATLFVAVMMLALRSRKRTRR
jgi:hypothetical protein